MHGIHGSDHHLLALVKSSAPGFHHCSWDVASVNDIGLGAMRMHDKGWTKGWGLGRHVLGSNYFHYVRDPWGSFSEYSCDIDYIPKEERWPAADHKPEGLVLSLGSGRSARVYDQLRRRRELIILVIPRHAVAKSQTAARKLTYNKLDLLAWFQPVMRAKAIRRSESAQARAPTLPCGAQIFRLYR